MIIYITGMIITTLFLIVGCALEKAFANQGKYWYFFYDRRGDNNITNGEFLPLIVFGLILWPVVIVIGGGGVIIYLVIKYSYKWLVKGFEYLIKLYSNGDKE